MERAKNLDVALIYELWQEMAAAVNERDLERWLALWTEDAVQLPPSTLRQMGKRDIQRGMGCLFDRFHVGKMVIQTEEIRVLGDWAFSHGAFAFEKTPIHGGEPHHYTGKFLDVLQKQSDGTWKIAVDCFNYDAPGEQP